jgi:hypothetical protein
VGGIGAAVLVGAAAAAIEALLVINKNDSTMVGDTGRHPTTDENSASHVDTNGSRTGGAMSDQEANANQGGVKGSHTDAAATQQDAKAADTGASAAQPKAGGLQVMTKGMNIA